TADPTDNRIIECALAGKSDYIVTGGRHLLDLRQVGEIKIMKPADFLGMHAAAGNTGRIEARVGASDNEWWMIGVPKNVRKKVSERHEEDDNKRGGKEYYFDLIDY